jgi:oxygen-independent coproporphyrinogen-3 oxidase
MPLMAIDNSDALGLYISIPFCRSKCTYCNFASGVYPASEHTRYVERLIEDLQAASKWAASMGVALPRRVDTVYLGGGTPSLLAPDLLARLFAALRAEFDLEPETEITVECAPGQIADETLEALVKAGVNRVSLGVQSFIDREAATSGRLHTRAVVGEDLRRLRAAGIANLNLDLIAGLAGQTFASWDESLAVLIGSGVPHVSVYMLEVDEDSRLGREMLAHGARYHAGLVPSDDAIAQMYSVAIDKLTAAGLGQYEISNFCRPGFASRHNLRYWQSRPYLGLGLDASSMLREALHAADTGGLGYILRATTTDDLTAYLAGPAPTETAWLSPDRLHEEAWFLGLRLNEGVDVPALEQKFGPEPVARAMKTVARLAADGLLTSNGNTVRLTAQGQLLSNEVFQEFLEFATEENLKTPA